MNKASLDRGFGRCIVHHTYKTQLKKYANRATDRIVAPEERRDRSHLIESDGLAVVGRVINPGGSPRTCIPTCKHIMDQCALQTCPG
jgi:DNA-directed RNA polymerase III subunit RPC2